MKATIITDEKRNALDRTINWMMGIETKTRNEEEKKKGSPYNAMDYVLAIGSSSAVAVTMVMHPTVAVSVLAHDLVRRRLEKKEKKFYETPEEKAYEEIPVVESEAVSEEAVIEEEVHEGELVSEEVAAEEEVHKAEMENNEPAA